MGTNIVAIAFDQAVFSTDVKCEKYIRGNPTLSALVDIRGFKLRSVASSKWMAAEGRKIFWWEKDLWSCKHISVWRPEPSVMIISRVNGELFTQAEVPALYPRTLEKMRLTEKKQEERDRVRETRRQKVLENRKRKRAVEKGSGTKLAKEFAAEDEKLATAENKKLMAPPKKRVKAKSKKVKSTPPSDLSMVVSTDLEDGLGDLNIPPIPTSIFEER